MNLVVYSPLSFRFGGGFERSFLRLVPRLRELGIRCDIFCTNFLAGESQRLTQKDLNQLLSGTDSTYTELRQTTIHNIPILHASSLAALARGLREADVGYWSNACALQDIVGSTLCRIGTPVICGYHAILVSEHFSLNQYINHVTLPLAKRFNASHVLNTDDARTLQRWKSRRVYLITPGVDTNRFRPRIVQARGKIFRVLFVGRLVEQKGLAILCEVIKLAKERGYEDKIRFSIAGSGPLQSLVNDVAKRARNVEVLGQIDGPKLEEMYSSADILIMPSFRETFGNVALEALASGLPVVAFSVAGLRDFITNGGNGMLSFERNAYDLFNALEDMFVCWTDHRERFALMQTAARESALRYDLKDISVRFADMIREVSEDCSC
jgi:glycosyltransferase involved in cell wall biosynthesis